MQHLDSATDTSDKNAANNLDRCNFATLKIDSANKQWNLHGSHQ